MILLLFVFFTCIGSFVVGAPSFQCNRSFLSGSLSLSRAPFNKGKRPKPMVPNKLCPRMNGKLSCCDQDTLNVFDDTLQEYWSILNDIRAGPYYQGYIQEIDNHVYTILERLAMYDYKSYEERLVDESFAIFLESSLNAFSYSQAVYASQTLQFCFSSVEQFFKNNYCYLCSPFDIARATPNSITLPITSCVDVETNCSSSLTTLREQRTYVFSKLSEFLNSIESWTTASIEYRRGGNWMTESDKADLRITDFDLEKSMLNFQSKYSLDSIPAIQKVTASDQNVLSETNSASSLGSKASNSLNDVSRAHLINIPKSKEADDNIVNLSFTSKTPVTCSTYMRSLSPEVFAHRIHLESQYLPLLLANGLKAFLDFTSSSTRSDLKVMKNALTNELKSKVDGAASMLHVLPSHSNEVKTPNPIDLHYVDNQQLKNQRKTQLNNNNSSMKKPFNSKPPSPLETENVSDNNRLATQHPSPLSQNLDSVVDEPQLFVGQSVQLKDLNPSFGVLHRMMSRLPPHAQTLMLHSFSSLSSSLQRVPVSGKNVSRWGGVAYDIFSREYYSMNTPRLNVNGDVCSAVSPPGNLHFNDGKDSSSSTSNSILRHSQFIQRGEFVELCVFPGDATPNGFIEETKSAKFNLNALNCFKNTLPPFESDTKSDEFVFFPNGNSFNSDKSFFYHDSSNFEGKNRNNNSSSNTSSEKVFFQQHQLMQALESSKMEEFEGTIVGKRKYGWCWTEPPIPSNWNRRRKWGWCTKFCEGSRATITNTFATGILQLKVENDVEGGNNGNPTSSNSIVNEIENYNHWEEQNNMNNKKKFVFPSLPNKSDLSSLLIAQELGTNLDNDRRKGTWRDRPALQLGDLISASLDDLQNDRGPLVKFAVNSV